MAWLTSLKRFLGMDRGEAKAAIAMMNCDEVMALLHEYIDGEIDEVTRLRMDTHLGMGECECQRMLLFEVAFLEKVKGTQGESIPEDLRRRIVESLNQD